MPFMRFRAESPASRRDISSMEAIVIDVARGHAQESQSGLQLMRPRIWGAFHRQKSKVAAIVIHPTSNFMGHYLLEPLASRGIACLGLNTRYLGSDVSLLLERAIQDLGAGVRWLRAQGYNRILLIGNSGGGALVSMYQAQAENLTIHDTPAGDPIDLRPEDLPQANGIALNAAHLGRYRLLRSWIDPAVMDEHDPWSSNVSLDMFNSANGPPYSKEFMATYRVAQAARLERIEKWALELLCRSRTSRNGITDMAFVVHRTLADPRCLDPTLDPNDRTPGTSVWGPPREQNLAANSMGRYSSLKSFLSQWASCSRGDGPANLTRTRVPVLLVEHTADPSTFPSDILEWSLAASGRVTIARLSGGTHYLAGQPKLVSELADYIAGFADRL
jgi:pimeloyl-ACP methyl ester carboxylesterase